MTLKKHLKKLSKIKRKSYHPLVHKVHKKYGISTKTLHYIKEYDDKKSITKKIIKESIWILLFASLISSFGGLFLENIKEMFVVIVPLIILLPTLNDMIGDYGMILSSRFTTMLFKGRIHGDIGENKGFIKLILKIILIATITATLATCISFIISKISGFQITGGLMVKLFFIVILDVYVLIAILCLVAFFGGKYYYKKNEDPDNFLIPLTTSIADFGNMIILTILVRLLF